MPHIKCKYCNKWHGNKWKCDERKAAVATAEVTPYREALRALVEAANDYNQKLYRAVANDTVRYEADPLHAAEERFNKALADAAALLTDEQNGK